MLAPSQSARAVRLKTPLGPDALVIQSAVVREELGRPFTIDLQMLSLDHEVEAQALLGKAITVELELPSGEPRFFNGIVTRFCQTQGDGTFAAYEATLRPWLALLEQSVDSRILEKQSVPDIVKQVFRDHGFTDFQDSLSGSYRPLLYCVQYNESAFAFVSRLLESEGIYYWFDHTDGKHELVLSDGYASHQPASGYATLEYYAPGREDAIVGEKVVEWQASETVCPGMIALDDFDFEKPAADLEVRQPTGAGPGRDQYEIYDYPAKYLVVGDGETTARTRAEELSAKHQRAWGRTTARGIATGALFTLEDHPRDSHNREYLVISSTCQLRNDNYVTGGDDGELTFHGSFVALDAKVPFRPERITPRPKVEGPQTAIVIGEHDDEIETDEHGRVKLQFHWDRRGKKGEKNSHWVRVSQLWAGKGWGGMHLPRIGQEVIVDYLDGDPDRPIVTGRVYNGANKVPYDLPANKTQSGIKSRSSKQGTADNFNEIRFEDKKGEELFYVHAEKDQEIFVENDRKRVVENDESITIEGNRVQQVKKDEDYTVDGVRKTNVVGDYHLKLDASRFEKVASDRHLEVGGDFNTKTGGDVSLSCSNEHVEASSAIAVAAGTEMHLKAGTSLVVEAGTELTLKVGGNFVKIDASGVTIVGTTVNLNCGGAPGAGSGPSVTSPTAPEPPKLPE